MSKQEQVQKQPPKHEQEPIEDLPEAVDESVLDESTTELLGKTAIVLEEA